MVAALTGDHDGAARVELTLPDTGVCGGAGLFDDPTGAASGGCCGAPASAGSENELEVKDVGPQFIELTGLIGSR